MTEPATETAIEEIDLAIDKGINYLSHRQFLNGEFLCYISGDEAMQSWNAPDSCNYISIIIGHCLLPLQDRPVVNEMLTKLTDFIHYHMMRAGVWSFFTKFHWLYQLLAPDVDDTSLALDLLKKRNLPVPDNKSLILQNRNKSGLFYTWFTIHDNFWNYSLEFWRLIVRELKHPIKTLIFWLKYDLRRNDIDLIVNANVVAYLGNDNDTASSINYIASTLKENKEDGADHWYNNIFVKYYFIARLVPRNIEPIVEIKDLVIDKIQQAIRKYFPETAMEIALIISSLSMLGSDNDTCGNFVKKLLQLQLKNGMWDRYAFYNTPDKKNFWGSEEFTTALCIEALQLYKTTCKKIPDPPSIISCYN